MVRRRRGPNESEEGLTLTRESLLALRADRLADLLLEIAERDETLTSRLSLSISSSGSETRTARLIRKRLHDLLDVDFVYGRGVPDYAATLDALRRSIVDDVQPRDPLLAADLLGELVTADSVIFEHVDDSDGEVSSVVREAVRDWGRAWSQVSDRDSRTVASIAWDAYCRNDYGARDGIIEAFADALGAEGLSSIEEIARAGLHKLGPPRFREQGERFDFKRVTLSIALCGVADAKKDPDLYVEALEQGGAVDPHRVDVAERMLAAGRIDEALTWLDSTTETTFRSRHIAEVKLAALDAAGRTKEAQDLRWNELEKNLDIEMLQDFLERLESEPERIRVRAEAVSLALSHPSAVHSLRFLIELSDHETATRLILSRSSELDGGDYWTLVPAAEALFGDHPQAALILYRKLLESILERANSRAYHHAVDYYERAADCSSRAGTLPSGFEGHEAFNQRLRARHGRKTSFWSRFRTA